MSAEENKATDRRFYEELFNQKNLAVIDEVTSEDFVSHSIPAGLPSDREGFKIMVSVLLTAFPDWQLTVDEMIAVGDTVAARFTYHGTNTSSFEGIPPTGRKVTIQALHMARFANGKLVEHWGGPDQLSLLQQLGFIPSAVASPPGN